MAPALKTILIVDDDEGMRDTLTAILKRDYRVLSVSSAEDGLSRLRQTRVDLMLLDVRLPGIGGLELLRQVREQRDEVEVIMISAITDVETAVQAMKLGAYHYITKEFDYDALRALVRNASERQDLRNRVESLTAQVQAQDEEFVTGTSATMKAVVSLVQKVARLDSTVLITGESGTGKEMLARRIHAESDRRKGPFIAVNLAAVPSELVESTLFGHERGSFTGAVRQQLGKFELANGGTLFLDEIGDLRLDLQAKLLRAIQENEIERVGGRHPIRVDFRLVVATNADLSEAVRQGRFREDLFYRINVIPVRLPPCAIARRTSASCWTCSSGATRCASGRSCAASSRRRSRCWNAMPGRATSGSCRTWPSGWWPSATRPRSPRPTCRSRCSWPRSRPSRPTRTRACWTRPSPPSSAATC